MSNDDVQLRDEVSLEVTSHDPLARHKKAAKPAKAEVEVEEEPLPELVSIDEAAWTAQDTQHFIIDKPEQWPTQDYVKSPPAPVEFSHPVPDSI